MKIQVINKQKNLKISAVSIKRLVKDFLHFHCQKVDEVTIHFVDTDTICQLHADFFNDPSTTDCISFPMDDADTEGYRILGEVFVCPETAVNYVADNGGDAADEVNLYVVHGLLHLLGYDDTTPALRKVMRAEERRFLERKGT